jgi:tetratricopeptide (TPR) repeat protein
VALLGAIEKLGPSAVHQGLQYLKQFYTEHDREDPVVLILLADHFFYKKDYAKALTLSTTAANSTRHISDQLRANAAFMQAKCFHAQSLLDDAFSKYLQVTKLDPNHPAGLFGLSQLYVHRNDLGSAIKCLELIHYGNDQASALLGCLYVQRYSETGEEDLLEKASNLLLKIQAANHPSVVKLALAIVLENKDAERALNIYEELLQEHPELIETPERLANISLLYLHFGKLSEARNIIAKVDISDSNFKFLQALLLANSEDENQFKEIGSRPALLHLAHKYIASCRFLEATELFKELLGLDEQNREAWFGMAVCHLRQRAFTPARKCFERILGSIDKHDLPSLCGLAVVYIELARRDPERHSSLIRRSLEFSGKALSLEPQCHVAANAAGVALAELGLISSARDAFLTLLDLSSKLPENRFKMDVLNNVGCVMVESGQFEEGQLAFQKALEIIGISDSPDNSQMMFANRQAQFILLYSRAAYAAGKHSLDARHFRRAISKLEEMEECDGELVSMGRFDIALCQQEAALALFKKCAGMVPGSAIELLTEALEFISNSITGFSGLIDGSNSLNKDMIKQRLSYSNSLLSMIEKRRDEVKEKEVTRLTQLQQVRTERSKAEERTKLQEDMEAKRLKEEQALIEEQRKKLAESVKITEEPKMEEVEDDDVVEEHPKKKGKRKKKEPIEKSPSKKSTLSKEYISSSSSEEEARSADELDDLFS